MQNPMRRNRYWNRLSSEIEEVRFEFFLVWQGAAFKGEEEFCELASLFLIILDQNG